MESILKDPTNCHSVFILALPSLPGVLCRIQHASQGQKKASEDARAKGGITKLNETGSAASYISLICIHNRSPHILLSRTSSQNSGFGACSKG
eukprot:1157879-Pelagomonas_calceolata.AAC.2